MQRRSRMIATLLVSSIIWGGASAGGTEPPYLLACTSLWTKLNNAPLTITTSPFTDIFEVNAAKNTVGGIRGEFTDVEISWENVATNQAVHADRTTHVTNKMTGKYVSLIRSFNVISGNQD